MTKHSVNWMPQAHSTEGTSYEDMDKRIRDLIVRSQHQIARSICEAAIDIPRHKKDVGTFLRNNLQKVVLIFSEGARKKTPLSYADAVKYRGKYVKVALRLFPGGRIPKSYAKLTEAQKAFLYTHGAANVALYLQKTVWIAQFHDKKLTPKVDAIVQQYHKKYAHILPNERSILCLCYGKNKHRDLVLTKREANAERVMNEYLSRWSKFGWKGKSLLIYGAMHVFKKSSTTYTLKIPASYRFVHKAVLSDMTSRDYCSTVVAKELAEYMVNTYAYAERNPHKKARAIKTQGVILDFLRETDIKALGLRELFHIMDSAHLERAKKSVNPQKVEREFMSAIAHFGNRFLSLGFLPF